MYNTLVYLIYIGFQPHGIEQALGAGRIMGNVALELLGAPSGVSKSAASALTSSVRAS